MRALVERSGDPHMGYRGAAVISDQPEAAGLATRGGPRHTGARPAAPGRSDPAADADRLRCRARRGHTGILAVPDRARRLHAYIVPAVPGPLSRADPQHSSLAAAEISGPAYPSAGPRRARRGAWRDGAFRDRRARRRPAGSSRAGWRWSRGRMRVSSPLECRCSSTGSIPWRSVGTARAGYATQKGAPGSTIRYFPARCSTMAARIDAAQGVVDVRTRDTGAVDRRWPRCLAAASLAAAPVAFD